MPEPVWKFFLCNSSDMSRIGELTTARSRTLDVGLNQSGSFSCTISMSDPLASKIQPITTCILVMRSLVSVWSGPIWTLQETLPDRNIAISAVGWMELLNRRTMRSGALDYSAPEISSTGSLTFEDKTVGGASGWTAAVGSNVVGGTTVYRGTKSMTTSTTFAGGARTDNTSTVSNLMVGVAYQVSAWYYLGVTGPFISLTVNDVASGATLANANVDIPTLNVWNQLVLQFTAVSGSIYIETVGVGADGTDHTIYWDEFAVTKRPGDFSNLDIGEIAQRLIDYTNIQAPCPVIRGITQASWKRTAQYQPFQKIGDEIQRMSQVENGFDWEIDPDTREFNVYYPMKGSWLVPFDSPLVAHQKAKATRYWKLDETSGAVFDSIAGVPSDPFAIGSGVTQGASTICSYDPGGKAASFNGTSSGYILPGQADAKANLDIRNASFSVSCLINCSSLSTNREIVTAQCDPFLGAGNTLQIAVVSTGAPLFSFYSSDLYGTAGTIVTGTTYHIACTYDKTSQLATIYINGGYHASISHAPLGGPALPTWMFGSANWSSTVPWAGTIDEIAVWNGRSLSPSEIYSIYQSLRVRTLAGVSAPPPPFDYGGSAQNLARVTRTTDPSKMTNWFVAQGKSSTSSGGALAQDPVGIGTYGAFEESQSLSEIDSQDILAAFANEEIAIRGRPQVLYDFTPLPRTSVDELVTIRNTPVFGDDFHVGDVLMFSAKGGTINVSNLAVRVFAVSITWDDNAGYRITKLQVGA